MNKFIYSWRVIALLASVTLFLGGCGVVPILPALGTLKLDNTAVPIKDLTVVIWFGNGVRGCSELSAAYSSKFKTAMTTRLPAIFEANGIRVKKTIVEDAPIKYTRLDNGSLSLPLLERVQTSHALILIADRFNYLAPCGPDNNSVSVEFDARLWDISKKHPVWSAEPSLKLILEQPLLRSQIFAASLLAALHKDGLIKLKFGMPLDLAGKPVGANFVWTEDR